MADGSFEPLRAEPLRASDALAAMHASRAKVMKAAECPPWRHALFAGLMSGVVAAQALPVRLFFGVIAVVIVGVLVLAVVMRARKGVFINGWRTGATRRVSLAIFGVYMAVYTISWWAREERGLGAAPLVGAAVLFPVVWALHRRWMRVYRAEHAA